MPNITSVLNEQIGRLARREVRKGTKLMKRSTGHYRRDIAALKRSVAQLLKQVSVLQKRVPQPLPEPAAEDMKNARLRVDGLKAHRSRLGLTAKEYGKLLGVSSLTVYSWENNKTKPRRSHLPRIVAVRGIGKREALRRLGIDAAGGGAMMAGASGMGKLRKKRGRFKETGQEMVLGLLKNRKSLTTREINEAWKSAGRGASADVLLGKLVKDRQLKRKKVEGHRGSEYVLA